VSKILYNLAITTDMMITATSIKTKIIAETMTNGSQLAGHFLMPEHNHALVPP
jgi:hypothetical protein